MEEEEFSSMSASSSVSVDSADVGSVVENRRVEWNDVWEKAEEARSRRMALDVNVNAVVVEDAIFMANVAAAAILRFMLFQKE
jgi:hypothetical protein